MLPGSIVFVHPNHAGQFAAGIFPVDTFNPVNCWFSVGRFSGRPYIIDNIWMTDCKMCNATEPTLQELEEDRCLGNQAKGASC